MFLNKNSKIYKYIDYSLLFFPIALILGAPTVNLYLIVYSFFFLYFSFKFRFFNWLKIHWVRIFGLFWIFLIISSFFANDFYNAFRGSFSLIRFLFFSLFIGYFAFRYLNISKITNFWLIIILIVSVDLWIQFFYGKDLFGVEARFNRLSGPFGDELVVGGFIWKITMCIIPFIFCRILLDGISKLKKYLPIIFFLVISVLITGERMSFLMYVFYLLLFFGFILVNKKNNKKILTFVTILIMFFSFFVFKVEIVKNRYLELFNIISNFQSSSYGKLFESGFEIWKKNPIIGVGVKNFRLECDIQLENREPLHHPLCSTHPHNLYLEILAETGIVGFIFFLFLIIFIFKFFYLNTKKGISEYTFISSALLISFLVIIWPISTSGSFFTTWNGSFYWLIIGLLFSNYNLNSSKN